MVMVHPGTAVNGVGGNGDCFRKQGPADICLRAFISVWDKCFRQDPAGAVPNQ